VVLLLLAAAAVDCAAWKMTGGAEWGEEPVGVADLACIELPPTGSLKYRKKLRPARHLPLLPPLPTGDWKEIEEAEEEEDDDLRASLPLASGLLLLPALCVAK
jgi:hypothetical protein